MTQLSSREWVLKARTPIWTGDADRNGERTVTTGLLGSLRWWFEVLVRGLGGSACDPAEPDGRCPDKNDKHCVVCELFGCTGWARKFRFDVLDEVGKVKRDQIKKDETFRFRFSPLRPMCEEEWALLDLTLRLISDYGATGGKTVLKPSREPGLADLDLTDFEERDHRVRVRNARRGLPLTREDIVQRVGSQTVASVEDLRRVISSRTHGEPVTLDKLHNGRISQVSAWFGKRHHVDYGLIEITDGWIPLITTRDVLRDHITSLGCRRVNQDDVGWASLKHFWCVEGRCLGRESAGGCTFNLVVGRNEAKRQAHDLRRGANDADGWLAGRQQRSKKVFSFKDPPRTFGFVKPDLLSLDEMRERLKGAWPDLADDEFLPGPTILDRLLSNTGGRTR